MLSKHLIHTPRHFSVFTESPQHRPSYTGPAKHTHARVSTFHRISIHREMPRAQLLSRIVYFNTTTSSPLNLLLGTPINKHFHNTTFLSKVMKIFNNKLKLLAPNLRILNNKLKLLAPDLICNLVTNCL